MGSPPGHHLVPGQQQADLAVLLPELLVVSPLAVFTLGPY